MQFWIVTVLRNVLSLAQFSKVRASREDRGTSNVFRGDFIWHFLYISKTRVLNWRDPRSPLCYTFWAQRHQTAITVTHEHVYKYRAHLLSIVKFPDSNVARLCRRWVAWWEELPQGRGGRRTCCSLYMRRRWISGDVLKLAYCFKVRCKELTMNHHHIHTKASDLYCSHKQMLGLFRSFTNINHDIFASIFNSEFMQMTHTDSKLLTFIYCIYFSLHILA
jgi:hypothetical protein